MASFTVPQSVRNNAKRGLLLRKQYGRGGLTSQQAGVQGIGSGVQRASDLIEGAVSLETVRRMSAFFDRHRKNKDTPPSKGNGRISWLLWGGDAGDQWAKSVIRRVEKKIGATKAGRDHGPSIKNPRVYEALRRRGMSKTQASRISNGLLKRKAKLTKTVAGEKLPASSFLVVGDPEKVTTWRLPVRDANGRLSRGRMGAAWAALHGGYRGNKYTGPNKAQAIAKLRKLYAQVGADVPQSKDKYKNSINVGRPDWNWSASAGESIGGGLSRGGDGKFTSAGGSSEGGAGFAVALSDVGLTSTDLKTWRALQSGKTEGLSNSALKKLKKMGVIDSDGKITGKGKEFGKALKNRDAEALRKFKPAKGGGGGGAGKPSKSDNAKTVVSKLGGLVKQETADSVLMFADGEPLKPAQFKRLEKMGLVQKSGDSYRFTADGKRLASALGSGKVSAARDAFLRAQESVQSKELKASFHVVHKEGKYRWVAISSNAYEDREGEIVSEKALKESAGRGDCGDLRWWHLPKTKLGTCDFQMVKGKMLIESGTFASEQIAKAFAKLKDMQMSIGFSHPPAEPKNGVYNNIKIFERSILPRGKAANALTAFQVS